jgi:hypothetical protein
MAVAEDQGKGYSLWQWCGDWYDPYYYERMPEVDPPGPEQSPLMEELRKRKDFGRGYSSSGHKDR